MKREIDEILLKKNNRGLRALELAPVGKYFDDLREIQIQRSVRYVIQSYALNQVEISASDISKIFNKSHYVLVAKTDH